MHRKTILLMAGLLVLALGISRAASPQELSLENALQRALANNFQVKILRQQERSARLNDTWGAAGRYPTLSLGLDLTRNRSDAPVTAGEGRITTTIGNASPYVNLRWTLFNGFAVSMTKHKLALLKRISEGNTALSVENTIQAVILAYYNALLQQQQLETSREVLALSKDRYDYVKMKKELGSAGTYDELQAKIAFLDDTARCDSQMLNLHAARRSLNQVMGETGETAYRLTGSFTHEPKQYALRDLVDKMKSSNRTLKNQYLNRELQKNQIRLSQSALYPAVVFNAGAGGDFSGVRAGGAPRIDSSTYNYYVGFSVNLTLSDGGRVRRAIANARINHRIAELQVGELELSLKNQLLNLLERYNIRRRLLQVAEEKMASAKLSLQISGEKFRSGAINSFNYRDSQLVYLNSAYEKLFSIYNLIESHTELVRITGGIITEEEPVAGVEALAGNTNSAG